ncbi:MAG: radical SAM protein [Planctomycetaceae bacterium]|nr:radical SAM protein [Planctomycetaceae bacterium]
MLDVSVLYGGLQTASTPHRYGRAVAQIDPPAHQRMALARSASQRRPIVVWNITRSCNLKCVHCYTDSQSQRYEGELSTAQCKGVLDDLAAYQVPAVLFSGGEPLVRPDLLELAAHARQRGLHVVLSTNGTMIDRQAARAFKDLELSYVGISLDSARPEVHDRFRGMSGAFERTLAGLRHCVEAGQKVGLRLTLTPQTCGDLPAVFALIERERINRVCFYHLVPAGRGQGLAALSAEQSRSAVDTIFDFAGDLAARGCGVEILTVDNHCDGAYLYLRMLREGHPRARQVLEMLTWNGGARFSSGVGIGNIDFHGNVHADQFSTFHSFGNVLDRPFSQIWQDTSDPIMRGLKDRLDLLKDPCGHCRFKIICGGSSRARAQALTGDPWAADPGCYLTAAEISGGTAFPGRESSGGTAFPGRESQAGKPVPPDMPEAEGGS